MNENKNNEKDVSPIQNDTNVSQNREDHESLSQEQEGNFNEKVGDGEMSSQENMHTCDQRVVELKERYIRLQADFENFKKRIERDREDMLFFLKYSILKRFLERVDDLERILKNTSGEEKQTKVYEGLVSLYQAFLKDFESLGVVSFESVGMEVDPFKHEVIAQVPSDREGIIIEECKKGYMLGEKLLRVASVVVGMKKEETNEELQKDEKENNC